MSGHVLQSTGTGHGHTGPRCTTSINCQIWLKWHGDRHLSPPASRGAHQRKRPALDCAPPPFANDLAAAQAGAPKSLCNTFSHVGQNLGCRRWSRSRKNCRTKIGLKKNPRQQPLSSLRVASSPMRIQQKPSAAALAGGIGPWSGWDGRNHRSHQGETQPAAPDPARQGG